MSWSVSFIGTPDKIRQALEAHKEKISGASLEEYNAVLPHLVFLIMSNVNAASGTALKLVANGHYTKSNDGNEYGSCQVHIDVLSGVLL